MCEHDHPTISRLHAILTPKERPGIIFVHTVCVLFGNGQRALTYSETSLATRTLLRELLVFLVYYAYWTSNGITFSPTQKSGIKDGNLPNLSHSQPSATSTSNEHHHHLLMLSACSGYGKYLLLNNRRYLCRILVDIMKISTVFRKCNCSPSGRTGSHSPAAGSVWFTQGSVADSSLSRRTAGTDNDGPVGSAGGTGNWS